MSDDEAGESIDHNGRTAKIDTGFYSVEVYGDPDDSLDDVTTEAKELASAAGKEFQEIDDRIDSDGGGMCR